MQGATADIGSIASSLSSAMGFLSEALKRIRSSATFEHVSYSGLPLVLQVDLAFSGDCGQCLSFLRRCAEYGEIVTTFCSLHSSWPTYPHLEGSQDLRDRILGLRFKTTVVSAKGAVIVDGLSSYKRLVTVLTDV